MTRLVPLVVSVSLVWFLASTPLRATEFHVATSGNDAAAGTQAAPFRTIQHAADVAQPGDTITVHAGLYREHVNPPRGGESDDKRIVYQAAPGEKVEIKGSEPVTGWTKAGSDTWKAVVPNTLFHGFNPYADLIRGDWFNGKGRPHHTGAVYLDGQWLTEAARRDDVLKPAASAPLWFAEVGPQETTLWAQFPGVDPNGRLVEINVRRTVFYPDQPGRNYITVRGFTLCHAATPWAPPTAEQVGLIGTHWSRGWTIENNTVSHSICSGISLGKHGDRFDNTSANSAEGYVKTIERAHAHAIPWTRENIGHHVVRNNTVSHCEQAGIVGSLGCAFSTVTGNTIHDIHVRRLFTGAEMAGIKFHGAIDTVIAQNHVHHTCRGLWLDWMAQGTRVSRNLFHDNDGQDLFVEVDHGPFVVDNNLFLSPMSLLDVSEGGAYVHNLLAGRIAPHPELRRQTPYHPAHATTVAGLAKIVGGDDRFYNNLFVAGQSPTAKTPAGKKKPPRPAGFGLTVYDKAAMPLATGGNVYDEGAQPMANEKAATVRPGIDPKLQLVVEGNQYYLQLTLDDGLQKAATVPVTTALLGKAKIPNLAYENADGSPLAINVDYFGARRSPTHPTPGPFENPGAGRVKLKVW